MSRQAQFDGSLMSSLAELREIEQERIRAERAALAAAEETRQRDAVLAEQRLRDQEARRVQAERDAVLALEQARTDAEREVRLRAESAEAAERARHQAMLDERRLTQELELRRAEVARKRPTWMVAITAFALVASVASSAFAIDRQRAMDDAVAAKRGSERDRQLARDDAREARQQLEAVQASLRTLDARVMAALGDVKNAQDAKDLAAADARLRRLAADNAAEQRRIDDLRRKKAHDDRVAPIKIDDECKHNAMTKKCLE